MQGRVVPAVRYVQAGEGQRAVHRHDPGQQVLRARHRAAPIGLHQPCQTREFALRQADPDRQAAEWLGDLLAQERARGEAGDPADHLADREAEHMAVVLVAGARLPERLLGLDRPDHRGPGGDLLEGELRVQGRDARAVAEDHPGGDLLLAVARELGPVAGDRGVQVEPALLGEQVGTDAHRALGAGEHRDEGVLRPGPAGALVGGAAPQLDHLAAAGVDGDGGAQFGELGEVAREDVGDGAEAFVGPALVLLHGVVPRSGLKIDRTTLRERGGRDERISPRRGWWGRCDRLCGDREGG